MDTNRFQNTKAALSDAASRLQSYIVGVCDAAHDYLREGDAFGQTMADALLFRMGEAEAAMAQLRKAIALLEEAARTD